MRSIDLGDKNDENQDLEILPDEEIKNIDISQRIEKLKNELGKCNDERKEYLDGWQRAKADFINYKKDESKRFQEMAQYVAGGLIQDLLPVLDSFDLALGHGMSSDVEKGVLLIKSQFLDVLKKRGLEVMDTGGQKFNPEFHESVGEAESDMKEGMIIEEIQKGYTLNGQVLRPARVKIVKSKQ